MIILGITIPGRAIWFAVKFFFWFFVVAFLATTLLHWKN